MAVNPTDISLAGLLGNEADRLLRTKWKTPWALAEELWAIFRALNIQAGQTQPIAFDAPGNPDTPSLTGRGLGPWQPFATWGQPDGPVFGLTPSGITADGIPIDGFQFPQDVTPGEPLVPNPYLRRQQPQPSAYPGQVQSGSGTGPYQTDVYKQGINGPSTSMDVTQLDVAESETIPAGTWTIVIVIGTAAYMQVPVWGDAET